MWADYPSRKAQTAVTAGGLAAVAALCLLDYATGEEVSFALFYLIPVAAVAWLAGRRPGMLASVCAAIAWVVADLSTRRYSHEAIGYWNGCVRLGMFLAISLLLARVKEMNLSLERKAQQRAEALAAERDGHAITRGALRDSEERFRWLIERIQDYAIFMLDAAGEVVTWNEGAERLTGYRAEEVLSRPLSFLLPSERAGGDRTEGHLTTAQAAGTSEMEGPYSRRDGTRRWAETVLTALRDPKGRLQGFSTIIHDLTARKQLENELLVVEERERRRIGRDLHDGLGQDLTGIAFLCKELEEALAAKGMEEGVEAGRVAQFANQAIQHARNLARGLCPVEVDSGGLTAGLERLAGHVRTLFGVECDFECNRPVPVRDPTAALHLYRIAQEAVANAVRHGKARRVMIRLSGDGGLTALTVEDDGCGIPDGPLSGAGMGLAVMKYRASAIGGTLRIARRAAGGTEVICTVPADEPADGEEDNP